MITIVITETQDDIITGKLERKTPSINWIYLVQLRQHQKNTSMYFPYDGLIEQNISSLYLLQFSVKCNQMLPVILLSTMFHLIPLSTGIKFIEQLFFNKNNFSNKGWSIFLMIIEIKYSLRSGITNTTVDWLYKYRHTFVLPTHSAPEESQFYLTKRTFISI
jgi:hypothetical protein